MDKTWDELKDETKGITCYLVRNDFDEIKEISRQSYGTKERLNPHDWKIDAVSRLVEDNLDYGKWNETEAESDDDELHESRMGVRFDIADKVAQEWVCKGGAVRDLETAQNFADRYIRTLD